MALFCSATLLLAQQQSAPLQLTIIGNGKVTGAANGQLIKIGSKVTLTAVPAAGYILSNWTANVTNEVSTKATYVFTNQPGLLITATFVTNPWPALKGDYNGLYAPESGMGIPVTISNAGTIKLTITDKGAFTGQLLNRGLAVPISGAFNIRGEVQLAVPRPGKPTLQVALSLDPQDSVMRSVTGTIGEAGATNQVFVYATPKVATLASGSAASLCGNYTLSFSPSGAMGYGAAVMTIKAPNQVLITGNLPNGAVLNVSSLIVGNSSSLGVPVFAPLGGKGLYAGWITITENGGSWLFSEVPTWYQSDGSDSGITTQLDRYTKPAAGHTVTGWTNGVVEFMDGGLPDNVPPSYVSATDKLIKVWQSTVNLSVTVDSASGVFSGSFVNPATKKVTPFKGVFVPDAVSGALQGRGWFMGPTGTGSILISQTDVQPPPDWAPKLLTGVSLQLTDSSNDVQMIIFSTVSQGASTSSHDASAFTYTYQKTGLATGKLKVIGHESVLLLDLIFTGADMMDISGTETRTGSGSADVSYTGTIISTHAMYAPTTLSGQTWQATSQKDNSTSMATFNGKQVQIQDNSGAKQGTFTYLKTGANTATVTTLIPRQTGDSVVITFTSATTAFGKNSKGDTLLLQQQALMK
ncbi:MAG: hypothetical protein WCO56_28715 [Verrucomicrobiota bacterium]